MAEVRRSEQTQISLHKIKPLMAEFAPMRSCAAIAKHKQFLTHFVRFAPINLLALNVHNAGNLVFTRKVIQLM